MLRRAHEVGHERLFALLAEPCDASATVEERVEASLSAALDALADEPDVTGMLFVEAPRRARRSPCATHEWLGHYGTLPRAAAPDLPPQSIPAPEVEGVIAGGIASRIASEAMHGRAKSLPGLTGSMVVYVTAFYRLAEPASTARSQRRTAA